MDDENGSNGTVSTAISTSETTVYSNNTEQSSKVLPLSTTFETEADRLEESVRCTMGTKQVSADSIPACSVDSPTTDIELETRLEKQQNRSSLEETLHNEQEGSESDRITSINGDRINADVCELSSKSDETDLQPVHPDSSCKEQREDQLLDDQDADSPPMEIASEELKPSTEVDDSTIDMNCKSNNAEASDILPDVKMTPSSGNPSHIESMCAEKKDDCITDASLNQKNNHITTSSKNESKVEDHSDASTSKISDKNMLNSSNHDRTEQENMSNTSDVQEEPSLSPIRQKDLEASLESGVKQNGVHQHEIVSKTSVDGGDSEEGSHSNGDNFDGEFCEEEMVDRATTKNLEHRKNCNELMNMSKTSSQTADDSVESVTDEISVPHPALESPMARNVTTDLEINDGNVCPVNSMIDQTKAIPMQGSCAPVSAASSDSKLDEQTNETQIKSESEESLDMENSKREKNAASSTHILSSVKSLKRRASSSPLERVNQRRRRLSEGEIDSKQARFSSILLSARTSVDDADIAENVKLQNIEERLQTELCEPTEENQSDSDEGCHSETAEKTTPMPSLTDADKSEEGAEGAIERFREYDKTQLASEECFDQAQEKTPGPNLIESPIEKYVAEEHQKEDDPMSNDTRSMEEEKQEEEDDDEDNSSSSGSSSTSSDSTSSSSSSSSSSDSESSDDDETEQAGTTKPFQSPAEAIEEKEHESPGVYQLPPVSMQSSSALNTVAVTHANCLTEQHALVEPENTVDQGTRDSGAMEIDESAAETEDEDEQEEPNKQDDEVKITRSEGLKLSISLKRSSTVATPTSNEEATTIKKPSMVVASSQLPLQPVDFSNLLQKGLNESQELVKIDYNGPEINYAHPTLPSADSSEIFRLSSEAALQLQQKPTDEIKQPSPAPWSNDSVFGIAGGNIFKSSLKFNHLVDKMGHSLPFVAPPPQEESSDTLDEDNRLVIAEKRQRRSRKKPHPMPPLSTAVTPAAYPMLSEIQGNHLSHPSVHALQQNRQTGAPQLHHNSNGTVFHPAYLSDSNFSATLGAFPNETVNSLINKLDTIKPTVNVKNVKKANVKRPAERKKKFGTKMDTIITDNGMPYNSMANVHKIADGGFSMHDQQAHRLYTVGPASVQSRSDSKTPLTTSTKIGAGMSSLAADALMNEKKKDKKKVFLCSPCGTHYENWNLFLHMREVHRKHICLYCLGIFQSAERLINHLGTKHGVEKKHHGSLGEYLQLQRQQGKNGATQTGISDALPIVCSTKLQQPFYLMCSRCEHMFETNPNHAAEGEDYIMKHKCTDFLESCGNCGQLKMPKHRCGGGGADGIGANMQASIKKKVSKKTTTTPPAMIEHRAIPSGVNNLNESNLKASKKEKQTPKLQSPLVGSILHSQLLKRDCSDAPAMIPASGEDPVSNDAIHRSPASHPQESNMLPALATPLPQQPTEIPSLPHHPLLDSNVPLLDAAETLVPLSTVPNDPNVTKPTETPAAPMTRLVPKLKVKIPIQYLTPMESEESSESEEGEEDDEEEEEEDDEDEAEEDDEEREEEEGEEVERQDKVPENCETTTDEHCEATQTQAELLGSGENTLLKPVAVNQEVAKEVLEDSLIPAEPEPEHVSSAITSLERDADALEDTSQQEPVPMDIDETITGDRTGKVALETLPEATPTDNSSLPLVGQPAASISDGPEMAVTSSSVEPSQKEIDNNVTEDDFVAIAEGQQLEQSPAPIALQGEPHANSNDEALVVQGIENEIEKGGNAADVVMSNDIEASDEPVPSESQENGIIVADSEAQLFQLTLDEPLDRIPVRDFVKICLKATVPFCLFCNHARRIAVCARQLILHIIATHRFQATVNSITGEELLPETILLRLRGALEEVEEGTFFNMETFDSSWSPEQRAAVPFVRQFECFQCRFATLVHKELYLHNRKMHQKSVLLCLMCKGNFFSYSELLCHLCPGRANQMTILDYKFRCCVCNVDGIPSAFRLMVHLRKRHFACDVCLEECHDQGRLSNHVWKHKLHHLCYRCGIGYRNKADILKHLFWKHGTEGVLCKRCLQKKWPHVYHFCVPPAQFVCEVCQATFSRSVALKVHQRLHNGDAKYPCTEDGCEKRFISKRLLLKHVQRHYPESEANEPEEDKPNLAAAALDASESTPGLVPSTQDEACETGSEIKTESKDTLAEGQQKDGGIDECMDICSEKEASSETKASSGNGSEGDPKNDDRIEPKDERNGKEEEDKSESTSELLATDDKSQPSEHEERANVPSAEKEAEIVSSKKSKKKRKTKDDDKSMVDLMNLPALNLSESDSSDDSDNENSNASFGYRRAQDSVNNVESFSASDCMDIRDGTSMQAQMRRQSEEREGEEMQRSSEMGGNNTAGGTTGSLEDPQTTTNPENTAETLEKIWNNFKRYQASNRTASRRQSADEEQRLEDELVEKMLKSTMLHTSQSDHDYCLMYKPFLAKEEALDVCPSQPESLLKQADRQRETDEKFEGIGESAHQHKSQSSQSPRKRTAHHSSDSDDSSDSDSSCECGSNCSCSSSSSNSSSSSTDDSDSSDEESGARNKDDKEEKGKKTAASESSFGAGEGAGDIKPEPPVTDVKMVQEAEEAAPPEPPVLIDPDSVIVDSDLQTDESETDEEFYDEHPQKLANQLLAEKRRQLLAQTCPASASGSSPGMMSYGIVENSRPSTPSLPPEEQQGKKKLKTKKRKRERKSSKRLLSPAQRMDMASVPMGTVSAVPLEAATEPPILPTLYGGASHHWMDQHAEVSGFSDLRPSMAPLETPLVTSNASSSILPPATTPMYSTSVVVGDMGRITTPRLSTGNSSESDAPLKRSQRSRKPNKFYGYTSDDESAAASLPLATGIPLSVNPEKSILSLMKPTPPPNLVWSKEDLPSPPAKSGISGVGKALTQSSAHRRSLDHLTPVSSRRNSGVGPLIEDTGAVLPGAYISPASYVVPSVQPALASIASAVSTPDQLLHRPPLPKLKLSLGKKTPRTSLGTSPKRNPASRRRKLTPKAVKVPKSAPPTVGLGVGIGGLTTTAAPLSAPIVSPAATASMYNPPAVVDTRPKIPPIGSFPSVQTDLFRPNQIRVPAGWRAPREGESVYCYCRAPYDEVSEMIACDGENCRIEWFHFECVGIIMPPKGKWFCPECKLKQPTLVEEDEQPAGRVEGFLSLPAAANGPSVAVQSSSSSSSTSGVWGQHHPS